MRVTSILKMELTVTLVGNCCCVAVKFSNPDAAATVVASALAGVGKNVRSCDPGSSVKWEASRPFGWVLDLVCSGFLPKMGEIF